MSALFATVGHYNSLSQWPVGDLNTAKPPESQSLWFVAIGDIRAASRNGRSRRAEDNLRSVTLYIFYSPSTVTFDRLDV